MDNLSHRTIKSIQPFTQKKVTQLFGWPKNTNFLPDKLDKNKTTIYNTKNIFIVKEINKIRICFGHWHKREMPLISAVARWLKGGSPKAPPGGTRLVAIFRRLWLWGRGGMRLLLQRPLQPPFPNLYLSLQCPMSLTYKPHTLFSTHLCVWVAISTPFIF